MDCSAKQKRYFQLFLLSFVQDGFVLPQQIGFDIEPDDNDKVPTVEASFLCDSNGQEIVRSFLQQYFSIYDSDDRQPLIQAYHEHAQFSMTVPDSSNPNFE